MPPVYLTGAEWPTPRYSFNGGHETAADARHRWKNDAECEFHFEGVLYDPGWNDGPTNWDAMTGWPLSGRRPPRGSDLGLPRDDHGLDYINVRDHLRAALTADINLVLYGWAQMENPSSPLRALTRNPGIFFFADGETMGRPAMGHYTPTRATAPVSKKWPWDPVEPWWFIPHPLQVIDADGALTWSLIGAGDFFAAAAGAPAEGYAARTDYVPILTRTGVIVPAAPRPDGSCDEPLVGFRCFWASLASDRDTRWQRWPYEGLQ